MAHRLETTHQDYDIVYNETDGMWNCYALESAGSSRRGTCDG